MRELRRYLLLLTACLALGAVAWSQDNEEPEEEVAAETEAAATAGAGDDEEAPVIDDESYIDIEEEDFRPTEEIDADQSIPFPTDI